MTLHIIIIIIIIILHAKIKVTLSQGHRTKLKYLNMTNIKY